MARAQQEHGKNMAISWQEHDKAWQGNNTARAWQEHGKNMARALQNMANTWQEHGKNMALLHTPAIQSPTMQPRPDALHNNYVGPSLENTYDRGPPYIYDRGSGLYGQKSELTKDHEHNGETTMPHAQQGEPPRPC
jgi:hypothetical protein